MLPQLHSSDISLFRRTRPDREIPWHWPSSIDRASPARVRSMTVASRPFLRRHLACSTAEVQGAPSPATPAFPCPTWLRVAPIPECPRNSPYGRRPEKFVLPTPDLRSLRDHSTRRSSPHGPLPEAPSPRHLRCRQRPGN